MRGEILEFLEDNQIVTYFYPYFISPIDGKEYISVLDVQIIKKERI